MDGKQTAKYIVFYQLLAAVAAVIGFAVVGLGVMMGFGESIDIVLSEAPQDWGDAVDAAQPAMFAILTLVGVVVWQLGKTVALVVTMGKVADASGGGAGGADVDRVRSQVMESVNDRISGVEEDVKKHEERLANGSGGTASSPDTSPDTSSGNRRSRRRGTAATGDDDDAGGSESTSTGSATGGGSATSGGESETTAGGDDGSDSNRRSNRRAAGGDSSGDGDATGGTGGDSA